MQWIYWLLAIVLSAGAGYWVYRTDRKRAVPFPLATLVLRTLVVFFTILLILVPTFTITRHYTEKPVVMLLQDNSRSIGVALGSDSGRYRHDIEALAAKLSANYKVVEWGFGGNVIPDTIFRYYQPATDISAAIARAQEFYGLQNLGAVILATDGRFNQGMNPLYQQSGLNSALYTVAIGDSARQKDLRIPRVYANKVASLNSAFEIRADIVGELCRGYDNTVSVKEGEETLASAPITINTDKYDHAVSFTIKAAHPGLHHYILTVPDAGDEKNTANNRKDVFVDIIEEKKNILIASAAPHPDVNAIRDALMGMETYKVTVCGADNFPASLAPYQVVILHGLPSARTRIASQLMAAHKPLWIILSGQTDIEAVNSMQSLTHTTVTPARIHDVLAVFNASFNAFILPQQIQSVTDKMPPLQQSIGSISATPAASPLFYSKQQDQSQSPLWLLDQGSIPAAVLAGEGIWRWRLHEFKNFNEHNVIDECIRQTVAFLAAANNEKPFAVALPKYVWSDQEAISLNAYMLNANNEQVNTPDVQLSVTDSTGRRQEFSMERSGSVYSLNIGVWAGGTYNYVARTTYNGKSYTASGSFVVESIPLELMESGADYPLLYSLARKYNGGFVPAVNVSSLYDSIVRNEHIKPLIRTNTESVPLVDRKWYFLVILLLATGEWLLRKYWLAQ